MIAIKIKTQKEMMINKVFCKDITFAFTNEYLQNLKAKINQQVKEMKANPEAWDILKPNGQGIIDETPVRITLLTDMSCQNEALPTSEFIILYAGGGGFLANLQTFQESFLKKWAIHTKIPIFQVHYSLSPEFKYPCQIIELLNVYILLHLQYTSVQKQSNLKIILMGDSAGGNLILALTNLIISLGLPIPAYIFAIYPPTDLNPRRFSPSMLLSMDDTILYFTIAKACITAYVPEKEIDYDADWLLSPLRAPDEILAKYPKTYFIAGEFDSLKDDSFRMAHKLTKLGVQCVLVETEGVKHGFLGYQLPFGLGIDEVQKLHEIIQEYLIVDITSTPVIEGILLQPQKIPQKSCSAEPKKNSQLDSGYETTSIAQF